MMKKGSNQPFFTFDTTEKGRGREGEREGGGREKKKLILFFLKIFET